MLKLALIENLRRLADEILISRTARRAADAHVARIDAAAARRAGGDSRRRARRLRRADAASRPRIRRAAIAAARRARSAPDRAPRRGRRHRPRRASAAGGEPGVGRQRDHQPAAVHDHRLAPIRRVGQPRRKRAAPRSGRRLRADGFSQPRSPAPGGRGARRARRRSADSGRAQGGRDARARARQPVAIARRRARRLSPGRQGPRRPRDRSRLSAQARATRPALAPPPRHRQLPRLDRRGHRGADRAGRCWPIPLVSALGGWRPIDAQPLQLLLAAAAVADSGQRVRDRVGPARRRPVRQAGAAAAARTARRRSGRGADHGGDPDAAHHASKASRI